MKKIFLSIVTTLTLSIGLCQKPLDISVSISPAFPIGDLSDYVAGGFGFVGAIQSELKKNVAVGGEIALHNLNDGYNFNTFFSVSAYCLRYFDTNYTLGSAQLRPYLGVGLGLYRSRYEDDFFGKDPPHTGLLFSPRAGIRMDMNNFFLKGEGRFHIGTGYADSFIPLLITFGYRLGGR